MVCGVCKVFGLRRGSLLAVAACHWGFVLIGLGEDDFGCSTALFRQHLGFSLLKIPLTRVVLASLNLCFRKIYLKMIQVIHAAGEKKKKITKSASFSTIF